MLYTSNHELPLEIRRLLGQEHQDLYRAAYNSALHWYGDEEKAHQVAWRAVKMQLVRYEGVPAAVSV